MKRGDVLGTLVVSREVYGTGERMEFDLHLRGQPVAPEPGAGFPHWGVDLVDVRNEVGGPMRLEGLELERAEALLLRNLQEGQ